MNRQNKLLEVITGNSKIEVTQLAEMFGVSKVTIRKDLDQLEEKGLIKREHGFALLASPDDIAGRLAYHYETKRAIATAAAAMVRNGETVMIESGSCCALLAEELAVSRQDVTIVTNSAFIANHIRRLPQARTILLGGAYQNESQVMVGPIAKLCAGNFYVDKLFIGADGFTQKLGFMGADHLRAETVRVMAEQANRVIILTEAEKFSRLSSVALLPLEKVAGVITDGAIPPDAETFLRGRKIHVEKVP